jgi:uncharacterized protein YneR
MDDRDCVKYIKNNPMRFECGHYFGGVNLEGACFSSSFKSESPRYSDITTILTEEEFNRLIEFNNAIGELGYGIKKDNERYMKGMVLCEGIQDVYGRLNSEDNDVLFEQVVAEEKEWLTDEYGLSEDDIEELFDNYGGEYKDRGIISYVFNSIEECAEEEAESLGYVTKENERWFDYEKFGEDLLEEERYVELSNGKIAVLNY